MGIKIRYREDRDQWVVTEISNGRRHQRSFAGEKQGKKQAREYAAAREAALDEAAFQGEAMGRERRRTFLEGLERWVSEYDVASQAKAIRPVAAYMGENVLIGQETVDKAREMASHLRKAGRAQSTINNHLQVVKRVLNLAYIEWGWISHPLGDKIRKKTPKNERHVYLDADQLTRLMEAIPDKRQTDKRVIALAALTGLRQGELLALEPSNIHGNRILLRPDQTKSGKARVVPVPEDALPWLHALPFDTTYARLRKTWEDARKAVGRPDLRFHDLRHSYASMLAQAGESMTTVRDLLGHSSLIVTSRYSHIFDKDLDSVAIKLPSFLNQKRGENAATH